jgi:hypothetical protein
MRETLLECILDLLILRWIWREDDETPWWTILMVLLTPVGLALFAAYLLGAI